MVKNEKSFLVVCRKIIIFATIKGDNPKMSLTSC